MNGTTQISAPVSPGSTICFNIFSNDGDVGDTLSMQWNNTIPGALFTTTGSYHPTGIFCWQPGAGDVRSQPYSFTVTLRDNNCPTNGSTTQTFFLYVNNDSTFVNLNSEHNWRIYSGTVYFDMNGNGIEDPGEYGVHNFGVQMQPEAITTFTNSSGDFGFTTWYDQVHTISPQLPQGWVVTSANATYTHTDSAHHYGNDFGINSIFPFSNLTVGITGGIPRCSTNVHYIVNYTNTGSLPANGRVLFIKDPATAFATSIPLPTTVSGDSLVYYFTNLLPMMSGQIDITLMLGAAGDTIHFATYIAYDSMGTYYASGENALTQIVVCSMDPNDKAVQPMGLFSDHRTLYTDPLYYTIRFQNTGTDTAFTVFIQDYLDEDLDLSTFQLTGNSHPVLTTIYPNRMVEFRFENILLPDSNVDEPNSHGFVQYSIEANPNILLPAVVTNEANIFFDSNFPVLTNTVMNTLVSDLFVTVPVAGDAWDALVFPNPFTEQTTIILNPQFQNIRSDLRIINIWGELVFRETIDGNRILLGRGTLSKGIYFYDVTGTNQIRASGKLVVN
jgi:uncharacterized repeat protein (TIGR01451 family)